MFRDIAHKRKCVSNTLNYCVIILNLSRLIGLTFHIVLRRPRHYDEFKKSTISDDDNIRIIQKPQISAKDFDVIIK